MRESEKKRAKKAFVESLKDLGELWEKLRSQGPPDPPDPGQAHSPDSACADQLCGLTICTDAAELLTFAAYDFGLFSSAEDAADALINSISLPFVSAVVPNLFNLKAANRARGVALRLALSEDLGPASAAARKIMLRFLRLLVPDIRAYVETTLVKQLNEAIKFAASVAAIEPAEPASEKN